MARGLTLAVNTLVVLILGMVILSGGVLLVRSIFDEAREIPAQVDKQTEQALFNILRGSKQRIAVLNNVKDVGRKEQVIFPIAVWNEESGVQTTFDVLFDNIPEIAPAGSSCSGAYDVALCPSLDTAASSYTLDRFASQAFYVVVDAPSGTQPGEYTYTIEVHTGGNLYARTNIIASVT